jgi:hypothetical protein
MYTGEYATEPQHGALDRQLSRISFTSNDPDQTLVWLCAIGGRRIPQHGPRELGRVRSAYGGTFVIYRDGLVMASHPEEAARLS